MQKYSDKTYSILRQLVIIFFLFIHSRFALILIGNLVIETVIYLQKKMIHFFMVYNYSQAPRIINIQLKNKAPPDKEGL